MTNFNISLDTLFSFLLIKFIIYQGSTCTFCEAILRESGFKTGLFTSPHLIDVKERFRLNGYVSSCVTLFHSFYII